MGGAGEAVHVRPAVAAIEGDVAPAAVGAEEDRGDVAHQTVFTQDAALVRAQVAGGVDVAAGGFGTDGKEQDGGAFLQVADGLDALFAPQPLRVSG
jgi:hypothetical protein